MIGRNNIKERIQKGDMIVAVMPRFPNAAAVEVMALGGVELFILDNEHYPFDEETMISMVRAADVHGAATMVRVPNAEPARIAQIMDYGADGILLPKAETYDDALQLMRAVKFAPVGTRGFCPITRAANYGLGMSPEEFANISNARTLIMVQIETKTGVKNLDKILTIPEIDGVQYGPSDLAASYGVPGHNDDPRVTKAVEAIHAKAAAAGKPICQMAATPEIVKKHVGNGARMVCLGSDQQMLMARCRSMVSAVK